MGRPQILPWLAGRWAEPLGAGYRGSLSRGQSRSLVVPVITCKIGVITGMQRLAFQSRLAGALVTGMDALHPDQVPLTVISAIPPRK